MEHDDPLLSALARLAPPVSNAYFHGQLLNVANFRREQDYFRLRDALQNRLLTGGGILAGLEVLVDDPAGPKVTFTIAPGEAVDPLGRLIVVPQPDPVACIPKAKYSIRLDDSEVSNAAARATARGHGAGGPDDRTVRVFCDLFVGFDAQEIDFAPVRAGDCDALRQTVPSARRETFVLSHKFTIDPPGADESLAGGAALFPTEPPEGIDHVPLVRGAYHQADPDRRPDQLKPEDLRVRIDRISLEWKDGAARLLPHPHPTWEARRELLTPHELLDLTLRLARRVDEMHRQLLPTIHSGDAQQNYPNNELREPIRVRVCNSKATEDHPHGEGVHRVVVRFKITGGGGELGGFGWNWDCAHDVETDRYGIATLGWKLGAHTWLQTVEASIALHQPYHAETRGVGHLVKFTALALRDHLPVPRVERVTPWEVPDRPDWAASPELTLQFNRPMRAGQLGDDRGRPDRWLRLWAVSPCGGRSHHVDVFRLGLSFLGQTRVEAAPGGHGDHWLARYKICPDTYDLRRPAVRFLLAMKVHGDDLQSLEGVMLDATFPGTDLDRGQVLRLWKAGGKAEETLNVPYEAFVPSGRELPSGDGQPGGLFHSVFRLRDWPSADRATT